MTPRMILFQQFLAGAIWTGYLVVGLYFLKFWFRMRDQLFLTFAIAFWTLGGLRLGLSMLADESEYRTFLYVMRLFAFTLILWAIFRKNREAKRALPG